MKIRTGVNTFIRKTDKRSKTSFAQGGLSLGKKLFFVFLLSLLVNIVSVRGQGPVFSDVDTLSIPEVPAEHGQQAAVPVDLVNTFSVGGFSIRVSYDSLALEPLSVDTTSRSSGFELHGADFEQPGIIWYYATSMTPLQNAISPGSGPVAIITFLVDDDAQEGFYDLEFVDEDSTSYDNQLTDSLGSNSIIPILVGGRIAIGEPTDAGGGKPIPVAYELMQNYPNPFNQQTEMAFSLSAPAEVRLVVFDNMGREVATVYSGYARTGRTGVVWSGRSGAGADLASGIYHYSLMTAAGETVTRKMTILK
jgi:hypothetical protein